MLESFPTIVIVAAIFALMMLANEIGFRIGVYGRKYQTDQATSASGTLKASVFGLVALVLGFSFSATTSRHEIRQRLVLDQANAIGTCYLRAGLLSEEPKNRIRELLKKFVSTRIALFAEGSDHERYLIHNKEIEQLMSQLWTEVETANLENPEKLKVSLIVPAANDVIDLSSTRVWAVRNHLPEPVLMLLLASVTLSSMLQGHSSGQAGNRQPGLWFAANIVFALVLFVVLDFDRPRKGIIRVDHTALIELQRSIDPTAQP
jgi:hypothetical protein